MAIARRGFLGAAALLPAPRWVFAQAATDRRFVLVLQRGAADGLDTLIPYADPAYARLRGALAIEPPAEARLDGSFALHPSLARWRALYDAGQAVAVHAVASAYRDRSHFDAQNVLESGGTAPYAVRDGWLNRLLGLLPPAQRGAIGFTPALPLALRGPVDVATWAPSVARHADDDLLQRIGQLYAADAQLHPLWTSALQARGMADAAADRDKRPNAEALGRSAAGFLARPDGPRVALLETGGWDTHSNQAGRLAAQLKALDALVGGLHDGLGAAWAQTVVLVVTEFGRTAAANGTGGTDHGTGAAALLAGGALRGGRVIADWPGLQPADLLDRRDLRPTLRLDTLITSLCAEAFSLDPDRTARVLFPASAPERAMSGLLRRA